MSPVLLNWDQCPRGSTWSVKVIPLADETETELQVLPKLSRENPDVSKATKQMNPLLRLQQKPVPLAFWDPKAVAPGA